MEKTLRLVTMALCLALGLATNGVDVSTAISTSAWSCLKSDGMAFGIPRVMHASGNVDTTGVQSIENAVSAGVAHVDGYIFPCYSCGNAASQVKTAYDALQGTGYGMLWYDIEVYAWSSSLSANQAFIEDMVNEGLALGITTGIYSSYYNWESIVGTSWSYPASKGLPIWYAHYDDSQSFSDFSSFGGWSTPAMKQYKGTTTACSVGVDYNWYPSGAYMEEVKMNATLAQRQFFTEKA